MQKSQRAGLRLSISFRSHRLRNWPGEGALDCHRWLRNMASSKKEDMDEKATLTLVQEEAHVDKRSVPTGKVRVHTVLDNVEEIASATLQEEQVDVTRVPVNQPVNEAPTVRTVDGVTIVPVLEEIMVIEKQLILREELHIHRRVTTAKIEVPVSLKKQRAVIERVEGDSHPQNKKDYRNGSDNN